MTTIDYIFNNLPSRVYTKEESSNLYKFLSSFAVEMDEITNAMIELRKTKFIDTAMGNDLDKLGALLNLKRFSTENDEGFRARVKTRVQTFIGGGTVEALKQIIRLALNVEPTVIEHYQANRNHLVFNNGTFSGSDVVATTGLGIKINDGFGYVEGNKYTVENTGFVKDKNKYDFAGKIAASVAVNGNISKRTAYGTTGGNTSLLTPATFAIEASQDEYDRIKTLDGSLTSPSNSTNGAISQQLFSFDLIKILTDRYGNAIWQGKTVLADKVALAKTIITNIGASWYGYGSGPNGNKSTFTCWNAGNSSWYNGGGITGTPSQPTLHAFNPGSGVSGYIDANGFINYIAYADASNGTIASTINTDSIEIVVEVNVNKVNVFTLEANKTTNILVTKSGAIIAVPRNAYSDEATLSTVVTNALAVSSIVDKRYILNPFRDAITNTASVTIQIPYDFVEGNITLENVKDILKSTKAAGIALLIKLIETQEDTVNITEQVDFTFEMGFSGLGGENYIGGR